MEDQCGCKDQYQRSEERMSCRPLVPAAVRSCEHAMTDGNQSGGLLAEFGEQGKGGARPFPTGSIDFLFSEGN